MIGGAQLQTDSPPVDNLSIWHIQKSHYPGRGINSRVVIQSSRLNLSSQLGATAGRLNCEHCSALQRPIQFVEPARRYSKAAASRPMRVLGSPCGTPFGFGANPTRRIPCLPLSSRTAGARANHCPVASQTTAKTETSGGRSIIKQQIAKLRVKFQQTWRGWSNSGPTGSSCCSGSARPKGRRRRRSCAAGRAAELANLVTKSDR